VGLLGLGKEIALHPAPGLPVERVEVPPVVVQAVVLALLQGLQRGLLSQQRSAALDQLRPDAPRPRARVGLASELGDAVTQQLDALLVVLLAALELGADRGVLTLSSACL